MKRIKVADALRGFSLLGIFIANLLIFQFDLTGQLYIDHFHLSPFNHGVFNIINILFVGSFMPIFAMLFGFSMDKLYQSMKRKGVKRPKLKLFRRAFFLMIIGGLHASYIWGGDILFGYGFSMLFVIPFIHMGKRAFKYFTLIIFGLLLVLFIVMPFSGDNGMQTTPSKHDTANYVSKITKIYSEGSYSDIRHVDETVEDPKFALFEDQLGSIFFLLIFILIPLMEVPLFTLGVYLSKSGWFEKDALDWWSSKLWIWIIPLALIGKSAVLWVHHPTIAENFTEVFGIILAFGYMSLFKYMYQKLPQHFTFRGLEHIGKMSLTFYLIQSVIGTMIFYGYGLGQFGSDHVTMMFGIFIILYVLQVLVASWYQRHWRYGPMEYLLRMFTYWQLRVGKKKHARHHS